MPKKIILNSAWLFFFGLCILNQAGIPPIQAGLGLLSECFGFRNSIDWQRSEILLLAFLCVLCFIAAEVNSLFEAQRKRIRKSVKVTR